MCRYVEESKVLVKIAGYADAANAKAMEQVIPIQPQSPGKASLAPQKHCKLMKTQKTKQK